MSTRVVPLSVVVLTFNEERDLEACLTSVADWAHAVFIVDSGAHSRRDCHPPDTGVRA